MAALIDPDAEQQMRERQREYLEFLDDMVDNFQKFLW